MKTKDRLYTVRVTFDFVVEADSLTSVASVVEDNVQAAFNDIPRDLLDYTVKPGVHADGWDDECIPYGGDGNTRTGDYK